MINSLILTIVSIVISISYGKSEELPRLDGTKEYFPNSINNQWTYERYDSLTKVIDTINVRIIGDTLIYNNKYMIWEYDYGTEQKRCYYSTQGDTIKMINRFSYDESFYIIPFENDQKWKTNSVRYKFDHYSVMDIRDVDIKNVLYNDVIILKRKGGGYNDYLKETIYFVPNLGILKMEVYHWGFVKSKNESWVLINSNIK